MIKKLDPEKWLEYNAKLQQKKNNLRKALNEMGILKKGAKNNFDKYSYFSEAQYKKLFTELLSNNGLELKFNTVRYETFDGTERQANGRLATLDFTLIDTETGFYEESQITGEGIDKGDKGLYKAYTGAVKYYLANTFLVATGDDPETESPNNTMNYRKPTKAQLNIIKETYGDNLPKLLESVGVKTLEQLDGETVGKILREINKGGK